jgi:hypothetical protein
VLFYIIKYARNNAGIKMYRKNRFEKTIM